MKHCPGCLKASSRHAAGLDEPLPTATHRGPVFGQRLRNAKGTWPISWAKKPENLPAKLLDVEMCCFFCGILHCFLMLWCWYLNLSSSRSVRILPVNVRVSKTLVLTNQTGDAVSQMGVQPAKFRVFFATKRDTSGHTSINVSAYASNAKALHSKCQLVYVTCETQCHYLCKTWELYNIACDFQS